MPRGEVDGVLLLGEDERAVPMDKPVEETFASSSTAKSAGEKDLPAPFMVGEGLPTVPPKLVAKIQRGEYVDMAELLRDNIKADRRRTVQGGAGVAAAVCSWMTGKPSGRREVPDILSWAQCFSTYACVLGEKYPQKVRELWAYLSLIVREARRCGGNGWRDYDNMFRQQASSAAELEWGKLNGSLYAVTFLAQQSGRGRVCRWCQESDHSSGECALIPERAAHSHIVDRSQGSHEVRNPARTTRVDKICHSWNSGRCRFEPYCRYRHVCSTVGCNEDHKAIDCIVVARQKLATDQGRERADPKGR